MTMILPVADKVSLKGVKPGDSIHFMMIKHQNDFLVTKIHVMESSSHENKDEQ